MIPNRIIVIGGSTVQGQGDPKNGGFVALLKKWHESIDSSKNCVFNLGIGGDTVSGMLARIKVEAPTLTPDLIIIYPGLNDTIRKGGSDSKPQVDLSLFSKNLKELVQVASTFAQVLLISAVPLDPSKTTPYKSKLFFLFEDAQIYTKQLSTIAEELEIPCLDLFQKWSFDSKYKDLLADGLHCNSYGHKKYLTNLGTF